MQRNFLPQAAQYTKNHKRRKAWQKIVSALACIVVFCTTYALILPAITMEQTTYCGLEEHQHSDACYESKLICPYDESMENTYILMYVTWISRYLYAIKKNLLGISTMRAVSIRRLHWYVQKITSTQMIAIV